MSPSALGIPLQHVAQALAVLPDQRTPTREDWQAVADHWRHDLDRRIQALQQLRDEVTDCIGCGCLSLDRCQLLNPHDQAGLAGPGPRRLSSTGTGEDPEN